MNKLIIYPAIALVTAVSAVIGLIVVNVIAKNYDIELLPSDNNSGGHWKHHSIIQAITEARKNSANKVKPIIDKINKSVMSKVRVHSGNN